MPGLSVSDAPNEAQSAGAIEVSDPTPVDVSALLEPFKLGATQRDTVLAALKDAPTGALTVIYQSRKYGLSRGNTGAALLMHRIGKGEHLDIDFAPDRGAPVTGYKRVRGSHGATTIKHPEGTDPPP